MDNLTDLKVESEEESESSDEEVSSATEVSTDSEFAREECVPAPAPPAILVTEATPPAPPPQQEYPLSRTRSAGGLATKRALELKRKYLLGEPSPPTVRKSDSTSQIDTKFEAFRTNISEFQKLLNPAPAPVTPTTHTPVVTFQLKEETKKPMPDIIKNLCNDAPVDLLTKGDSPLCKNWKTENPKEDTKEDELESDSLSEDSSHTETAPNQTVPRVEVHDEGGELIQLDSLTIVTSSIEDNDKIAELAMTTDQTVVPAESESSESCRDATTLALTETELSDWAAESAVLDDCGLEDKEERKRSKNPRQLSGPKLVHDAKNVTALTSHVCGRTSPAEPVVFSNAAEHFKFADEGEQDPTIENPVTPKNLGYMELVDDEYDYSLSNDRSMNFIEKSYSETVLKSASQDVSARQEKPIPEAKTKLETKLEVANDLKSPNLLISQYKTTTNNSMTDKQKKDVIIQNGNTRDIEPKMKDLSLSGSQPAKKVNRMNSLEDISPPLVLDPKKSKGTLNTAITINMPNSGRLSLKICKSASETFHRPSSRNVDTPVRSTDSSLRVVTSSSGSMSPVSPVTTREMTDKVQEIKKEREEQTELVRRLVLERLGNGLRVNKKSTRRARVSPASVVPPPVPPPPVVSEPPPRPTTPLMPIQVTPSFSDPELARERRRKSIMKSISNYLNRRLGPRNKEPQQTISNSHKSTGALQEPPPVPPLPVHYSPPEKNRPPQDNRPQLTRAPAEQQASTVAELVQISAQRDAHSAFLAADRKRGASGSRVGD